MSKLFNVIKLSMLLCAAASMLFVSSAQAQWILIDDFDGLAAGDAIAGTTGPGATWTTDGTATATADTDPDCAANLAMLQTGAPGASVLRAAFTQASTNIAAGTTGTLFYRIRVPVGATGTTDHVIALTEYPDITNFQFKSGLRNIVSAGANQMDARNGSSGGYVEVARPLADNAWYNVWMVSTNTNPGTFGLYLQSDTDPAYALQTRLASVVGDTLPYRVNGATAIVNVYFRNLNNFGGVAGNDIHIDDIYINPSASDLSTPSGVGAYSTGTLRGDVDLSGMVDFSDIPAFIAVLQAGGFQAEADCDCNAVVDNGDIPAFITILQSH